MVKIICDSTADLPDELARTYDISVVPLNIHFGTESYRERIDITVDEFYKRLVATKVHPTTSAPGPGLFLELYKKISEQTKEICVITISSGISATYESAIQAKELAGDIAKIEVIDSCQTIGAEMLLILKAAAAAQKGANLTEILSAVMDALPRVHIWGIFDTLEYLRKGGRIGRAQAFLGGLLKFNPIITLKDGVISPVTRARSREQAMDTLVKLVKEVPKVEGLVIEDAATPEELEILADRLSDVMPKDKMIRGKISPVIGVHVGPHVLTASVMVGQ